MSQYRTEIDRESYKILRCAPAYQVAKDGVLYRAKTVVIRYQAESLPEARALAAFYRHKLMKKGEL